MPTLDLGGLAAINQTLYVIIVLVVVGVGVYVSLGKFRSGLRSEFETQRAHLSQQEASFRSAVIEDLRRAREEAEYWRRIADGARQEIAGLVSRVQYLERACADLQARLGYAGDIETAIDGLRRNRQHGHR
jgi:hypothetical protein